MGCVLDVNGVWIWLKKLADVKPPGEEDMKCLCDYLFVVFGGGNFLYRRP